MGSSLYGLAAALASGFYATSFLMASRQRLGLGIYMGAVLAHGVALLPEWLLGGEFRFGFAHAISWMVWLAALLWLIERGRASAVPAAARHLLLLASAAPLLPLLFPGVVQLSAQSWVFRLHILLAMVAYSTFAIAALQGVVMQAQERALHSGRTSLIEWLGNPSLLEMDAKLARTMAIGLFLLGATLVSGVSVNMAMGKPWMVGDHKTIFTLLTAGLALVFWVGRWARGWRGLMAARFAVGGLTLLLLSYVGSRFVTEVLLARGV